MRVAFDVKGTLDGHKGALVQHIFEKLQERGVECVVWSNNFSYAVDIIKTLGLENTKPMSKKTKVDLMNEGEPLFDLAIEDDRSQTWLGAKDFAFVDELTTGFVFKKLGLK